MISTSQQNRIQFGTLFSNLFIYKSYATIGWSEKTKRLLLQAKQQRTSRADI